ncbi:PLP-dependent aminotransferase family protein [Streptomyces sp. NPDC059063]|uniref:MocR-like pyridoxine biosynthesis transcription factor PdxR n=1 Tax=unclassified Streptomyces TaxID=2593676 RepID=UPI00369A755E
MSWHLQLSIDRSAVEPLHEQLRTAIKHMITTGLLRPGAPLPSSRRLAADLQLSRSVVVEAYQQLTAEGYLHSVDRSSTRVAEPGPGSAVPGPARPRGPAPGRIEGPARRDLRSGPADVTAFPRREWLACLRQVLQTTGPEQLEYPPLAGVLQAREEIAAHIGRVRAVRTTPQCLMVTAGFAQGLTLLCLLLRDLGVRALAVEDPGNPGQRRVIEEAGLRAVPVPVDGEGLVVDSLARGDTRAVLTTPTHQFPSGVVLSPARRAALVSWARDVGGIVIEDDYDGEFWFDRSERPASLQNSAPDHVVYAGSVSSTLAPGLRFGWLAVPPHLAGLLERVRARQDLGGSSVDQLAYAEFIRSGRLERHLRRMRKRYRERLETLVGALESRLPEATVHQPTAGLHLLVSFPEHLEEPLMARTIQNAGVMARGISEFALACPPPSPAVVIGYAPHSRDVLTAAVEALAEAAR